MWIYNDKNFFLQEMQQAKVDTTEITKPRHLIQQTMGTKLIFKMCWTGYFCYVI